MSLGAGEDFWKRGCSECRGPEFKDQDRKQSIRNCFNRNPKAGEHFCYAWAPSLRECPWSAIGSKAWMQLRWFNRFKATGGVLGDILHQPAYLLDVISTIESTKNEWEQAQLDPKRRALPQQSPVSEGEVA